MNRLDFGPSSHRTSLKTWPDLSVVSISQLSARTGATVRALRHYEEQGLIRSIRVRSGARHYSTREARIAEIVVILRAIDIPIDKIRAALLALADKKNPFEPLLVERAEALERKLALAKTALDRVQDIEQGRARARRAST